MSQFLTCSFKLHNLSQRKRDVLDYALTEYTLAYQRLLDAARADIAAIRCQSAGPLIRKRITHHGMTVKRLLPPIATPIHSSLKDSLYTDVAGNMASYLTLLEDGEAASYPTSRDPAPDALTASLDEFALCIGDDFEELQSRYLRQARGRFMPLYFGRPDGATGNRNFSLLRRQGRDGLFAVLFLLPARHPLGAPIGALRDTLVRVDTGEIFNAARSTTCLLVPLELGRNGWQYHKFIEPSIAGQASIKSAFLSLKDDGYYLHVAFEVETPAPYKPAAYIGIDVGMIVTAAYALIDGNGDLLRIDHCKDQLHALQIKHGVEREKRQRDGKVVTKRHYKRQAYDNILHTIANALVDLAREHHAQLVLEDIDVQVKGSRTKSRFRKLGRILDYKCTLAGVPPPRRIWAAFSSQTCHRCGCVDKGNRPDRDTFRCVHCGYTAHADENAAVNIARRALYRKAEWKDWREFHRSFATRHGVEAVSDLRWTQGALDFA